MLRRLLDLPLLVLLLGFAAVAMLLPAVHALVMKDHALARAFFYMALLVLVFTGMLGLARANHRPRNVARSHLLSLAIAYLILPPVLALPLTQRPAGGHGFGAAWFEMISDFTTTGAVVLQGALKPSVHLWRAEVGWLGGFFALVMVFSVLAPLSLGGFEVESGRMPGRASPSTAQITRVADPSQRMVYFAAGIFPIYGGLTLLLWLLLMVAGEDSFIALCHAMSTLATSGISPGGGIAAGKAGWLGEGMVLLFLLLALSRRPLQLGLGQSRDMRLWRDPEIRLALGLLGLVGGGLFLWHWAGAAEAGRGVDLLTAVQTLWGIVFTCLSFLTTTGYVSDYWQGATVWSGHPTTDTVLWALAIVGGGVATTAGGVKLLRVSALLRYGEQELDRVIHPNVVARSRSTGGVSREAGLQGTTMAWVFFMTFGLSIAAFVALMTLAGLKFDTALLLTISALTTTGPLAGQSAGIVADFAALDGLQQAIAGVAMVVGRIETLAILAILVPAQHRN